MASIPTFSSSSLLLKPNTNTNTLFPHSNLSNNYQSCTLSFTSLFPTRPISSTRSISIANCRASSATVPFSPPTDPNPQSGEPQKTPNPKWSARAIKAYAMAEVETMKLKFPKLGTELLLMGILIEGTSRAAKFLRANGITYLKVREQTLEILGRSDYYFIAPIDPCLTEPLQKALDWAINEKLKSGEEGETNVTHLLCGIWSQEESAGRKVLSALGFNDEKAEEIAKTAARGDIDWNIKNRSFLGIKG
ncbi:ATP-dependent Clp protease ATP-binding subunit CLPT1, chloroplastic-like [Vicia villosa]|uniref:ATP-dependent Clp protease ATP-binding subunit CLPT1, chloroplastic-like n=1 Tax=Vicia villosa TaxID=3911 RepID=UPI00273B6EFB|nr:ATP-dependent Clp protease ATP-binding subunit CLPT1, chloroplastic-like [Vicia villosa]